MPHTALAIGTYLHCAAFIAHEFRVHPHEAHRVGPSDLDLSLDGHIVQDHALYKVQDTDRVAETARNIQAIPNRVVRRRASAG